MYNQPAIYGSWTLTAHASESSEISPDLREPADIRQLAINDFFEDDHHDMPWQPVTGLSLRIGTFEHIETLIGTPQFGWFDEHGNYGLPRPFPGIIVHENTGNYIQPLGYWDTHQTSPGAHGRLLRWDEDTKLCDRLLIKGGTLIRIMSAVTDEQYTHRLMFQYTRTSP